MKEESQYGTPDGEGVLSKGLDENEVEEVANWQWKSCK